MCGVIGLITERHHPRLGQIAAELLKTLEYRGYDATGAAIQGDDQRVIVKKGVGAPSLMVHELGIVPLSGKVFCGQVRWATFGAVTALNSQPHEVRCKIHLYGAHNGNVTNCDDLKDWLTKEGHTVLSDNDGEMVVHTVEHFFEKELSALQQAAQSDPGERRSAMRRALPLAASRLKGSYAAVIVDPFSYTAWALKQGSSLYFGFGQDPEAGAFCIASSDLSSVLKMTQVLLPLAEGQFIEYTASGYQAYVLQPGKHGKPGDRIEKEPVRSRLRAQDTALSPEFSTFMEQEIAAQAPTLRSLFALFTQDPKQDVDEVTEYHNGLTQLTEICLSAVAKRGRIYALCCGSSFHAAKAGAMFFNHIAHVELLPVLPGEFRGEHLQSLRDGDVLLIVSQSGETKDVIDVLNQVEEIGTKVSRIALVNNVNSTLAQEKADLVLPLRCGPEIAVPATKSFIAQVGAFYCMALSLGQRLQTNQGSLTKALRDRIAGLAHLPELIEQTLKSTKDQVERAAELLYLCPSLHLLATRITSVALEGALKIREVVLNHTQGFEGSEFKHGPNTILGWNTLFGVRQIEALVSRLQKGEQSSVGHLLMNLSSSVEGGSNYPLVYITGPEEKDVHLTVSQINTHKIRGATTLVVAEDHPALRQAAEKAPEAVSDYRHVYIALPKTGDTLLTIFLSTVVLQRLALRMSILKMNHLDRLGVKGHGVHPDVPKNVSKSITVD